MSPGRGGEVQLTDALHLLIKKRPLYGFLFRGKRYDAGDKFGFLQATINLALRNSQVSEKLKKYLIDIAAQLKD
jgi:UTP--glucose-1-phosphate uridylyltransferase